MLEEFKEALRNYTFLKPTDIFNLISIVSFKTIMKGECFIIAGDLNYNIAIVLKGLLRSYIVNDDGEEQTVLFVPERKNAGSSQTIIRNKPSYENIIALENTIIAFADYRKFNTLAHNNLALLQLQNKMFKELLAFTIDHNWSHLVLSAEDRYIKFCKDFPKLEQRVTQKDLASYLGITASSLSRIRARMAQYEK